jgi:O-acetyl-ADP-ribose deacetylase (regulator of RNase III)
VEGGWVHVGGCDGSSFSARFPRARSVRRALQNALRRTEEWGLETIAIAPFGTGAGNLDAEEAARVMIEVLHEHMQSARYPGSAEIIVDSDYEHEVFERQLSMQSLPHLYDPREEDDA